MLTRSRALRPLFAVAALIAAAVVHGQDINVTAANASNDAIYTVNFAAGTISVQNTDGGSLHSLRSLAFTTNPDTLQRDLLAADDAGGLIVRYCADFNTSATPPGLRTGTVVFSSPDGAQGGPSNPDGLSVDSGGNLFVGNQGSGTSTNPQLWVLQGLRTDCAASSQPATLQLIDSNYGAKETLEETLIAAATIPLPANTVCLPGGGCLSQISSGDLLLVTNNPVAPGSRVLLYPHDPQGLGQGPCTVPAEVPPQCNPQLTPFTLITLPTGVEPGGMAFWPPDNTLLVTTSTGDILRYDLTTLTQLANFVSGLGNGQFKVKTGTQTGSPFAFVADNNGGRLLEFSGPNQTPVIVTSGVQHPQGLAVTNSAFQLASTCDPGPCALLDPSTKKLITHQIPVSIAGNIIEDICLAKDPRIDAFGNCTNTASYPNGLPVAQVCGAEFDNIADPLYIPNYLCGTSGSGSPPNGFALVRTLTTAYKKQGVYPLNGTLIEDDSLYPGAADCNPNSPPPVLPSFAWAPLAGEGTPRAGNDVSLAVNSLRETTNGCGGGHGTGPFASVYGIGLNVYPYTQMSLSNLATGKYNTLATTITNESNESVFQQPPLQAQSLPDGKGNNTQLQRCLNTSQLAFNANNIYAVQELLVADEFIINNASPAMGVFTPNAHYINPSGLVRTEVENEYLTIDERINGGSPFAVSTTPPVSQLALAAPIPPNISGTPLTHTTAGTPYTVTPVYSQFFGGNPAPSSLVFTILNEPNWTVESFDPATGVFTGIAQKGTFNNITISVTDGCNSKSLRWNLKVTG
jgi:hypothetical protein